MSMSVTHGDNGRHYAESQGFLGTLAARCLPMSSNAAIKDLTFNHGVLGSSPSGLTNKINQSAETIPYLTLKG